MKCFARLLGVLLGLVFCQNPIWAKSLPHLQQNGEAMQLIVDDGPYIALAGELHNSSPSSPEYMAPIWDRLARRGVSTVIGAASWELVEPVEGRYDFAAVDDQIAQARARGMRLVLIWFGAYKNAESRYAPSWVRRDERRFPRAERGSITPMGSFFTTMVSVFSEQLVNADARAFAGLMRHIKSVDRDQTVIMMQVENEAGLLGDSRDRSAPAQAAWNGQVPAELIAYLRAHRAGLRPWLAEVWGKQGFRESGTWTEVFGQDRAADEVFMAWGFARFIDQVAKAGAAEHALPMYANAWLGPQPGALQPGDYPSGGPVARVMDIWKAGAPSLALLAPDIYVKDFDGTLADFRRSDNPIFIPEAQFDAGNLFLALGKHGAIGFSPFGIEDQADDNEVFKAYAALGGMREVIALAQSRGAIRGFKLAPAASQKEVLGGYEIKIAGPTGTVGAFGTGTGSEAVKTAGYGLIIETGPDQFLVVGRGVSLSFAAADGVVEIDQTQEGVFAQGKWLAGRMLNGDERYALFPNDGLRVVRISLLKRKEPPR